MIHIFCALPCEAQPIIQNFKLTEFKQFDLFRIYQSNDKEINLTITGIGKINAASAVSYHHACFNTNVSDIWLNIGVVGHANIVIGEARLANKITDEQTKLSWYPQIIFKVPCDSVALITLDNPSTDYQEALFDMEASGFYQMAIRLGTAELIHSIKIISDNTEQPTSKVNADHVKKIIAAHIKTIRDLMNSLQLLSTETNAVTSEPEHYATFIEQWHFTQSERIQLLRLLQQWPLRLPNDNVIQTVAELKTGKTVLNSLREKINTSEFMIHD
jgi:nucleoside phosphorylase